MDKRGSSGQDSGPAVLSISGMTCGGCASTVTRILSRVPGVTDAKVELESGRATVTGNARPQELIAAVEAAGYGAKLAADAATSEGQRKEHVGSGCCC